MCQCHHPTDHGCGCDSHRHACSCGEGDGECSWHSDHPFERHFQTKAEQIAELEAYLTDLKTEVHAVEEHLADVRR